MTDKGTIYSVMCKVNGRRYVGQTTTNLEKRWRNHITASRQKKNDYAFYKDLNRYGVGMFVIREIEEVDITMLDERERYWISEFDTLENGYNSNSGGSSGGQYNDATCKKISNVLKQKGFMKGVVNNPDGGKKLRMKIRGKNVITGEIKEFESLKEAAAYCGIKYNNISVCLNNPKRSKSAGGYTWERMSDRKKNHPVYGKRILDGKIVGPFDSIRAAALELNNDANNHAGIRKALKNPSRYSWKGCRWYYQD